MAKIKLNASKVTYGRGKATIVKGEIKILYSTEADGQLKFWIGGDRLLETAPLIIEFDLATQCVHFAHIDNTGPGLDDWLAAFIVTSEPQIIDINPDYQPKISEIAAMPSPQLIYVAPFLETPHTFDLSGLNSLGKFPELDVPVYHGGWWGLGIDGGEVKDPDGDAMAITYKYFNLLDPKNGNLTSYQPIILNRDGEDPNDSRVGNTDPKMRIIPTPGTILNTIDVRAMGEVNGEFERYLEWLRAKFYYDNDIEMLISYPVVVSPIFDKLSAEQRWNRYGAIIRHRIITKDEE
jgi:hypothetical protein